MAAAPHNSDNKNIDKSISKNNMAVIELGSMGYGMVPPTSKAGHVILAMMPDIDVDNFLPRYAPHYHETWQGSIVVFFPPG